MIVQYMAFALFAFAAILGGLGVITAKNPVYSILLMVWTFFSVAGLFILQGAEFLGFLLMIVYVGAIAVLFLFIVMMMNIDYVQMRQGFAKNLPLGIGIGVILMLELFMAIFAHKDKLSQAGKPFAENNLEVLGSLLYTQYVVMFLIAGVVLLVALIGAITLTHRRRMDVKRQDPIKQAMVDPSERLSTVKVKSGEGLK